MVLRAHLYIVEKCHLLVNLTLEGSVIGVGGEEKKNKNVQVLDSIQAYLGEDAITVQATEDVTRYNQCLTPECFALLCADQSRVPERARTRTSWKGGVES